MNSCLHNFLRTYFIFLPSQKKKKKKKIRNKYNFFCEAQGFLYLTFAKEESGSVARTTFSLSYNPSKRRKKKQKKILFLDTGKRQKEGQRFSHEKVQNSSSSHANVKASPHPDGLIVKSALVWSRSRRRHCRWISKGGRFGKGIVFVWISFCQFLDTVNLEIFNCNTIWVANRHIN